MEHQSSVTYGNGYQNGYLGRDLSRTGEGMKFDFIIIHEAGHEWFANNITNADVADMWIHEGFTNYSESLFLEYHYGKESAYRYIRGLRSNIQNNTPIIGPYDVRREGSSDMYYKGNNMLHTIRQVIDNDATWRKILRGLNTEFKHQSVSSQQVESYMSEQSGMDLQPIFDQYLRDIRIPTLTWRRLGENRLEYWWTNSIEGFSMPVDVNINGQKTRLNVKNTVSSYTHPAPIESIEPNREWYISTMDLSIEDISN
jgi:aminopeptidase N